MSSPKVPAKASKKAPTKSPHKVATETETTSAPMKVDVPAGLPVVDNTRWTLTIYMHSGNVIRIPDVRDYHIKLLGVNIDSLQINMWPDATQYVRTLSMERIEAITVEKA